MAYELGKRDVEFRNAYAHFQAKATMQAETPMTDSDYWEVVRLVEAMFIRQGMWTWDDAPEDEFDDAAAEEDEDVVSLVRAK